MVKEQQNRFEELKAENDDLDHLVTSLVAALAKQHARFEELKADALQLYMAGKWSCDTLDDDEQARLWVNLRNALGLPEGTATKVKEKT